MKWFQKHDRVEVVIKTVDERRGEKLLAAGV